MSAGGTDQRAHAARLALVIRFLHDALIEDLLDRAELEATGTVASPARWSPWVRLLRGAEATQVPARG